MTPEDSDTVMVGERYGRAVLLALCGLPGRKQPRHAVALYHQVLCDIAAGTGELRTPLDALAAHALVPLRERAGAVALLTTMRVVVRDPRTDRDAWFINPHLAWIGSLAARARFAALVQPPAVETREDA